MVIRRTLDTRVTINIETYTFKNRETFCHGWKSVITSDYTIYQLTVSRIKATGRKKVGIAAIFNSSNYRIPFEVINFRQRS